MSIIVSTPDGICNALSNNSKSKMLYSFPKNRRFKEYTKPLCESIYNIPDMFSKRKAALGYGEKSDFTKDKAKSPAPNSYQINNFFDTGL